MNNNKQIKQELGDVIHRALTDYIRSTRGANLLGASWTITRPTLVTVQLITSNPYRVFEIKITEPWS